MLGPTEWRQGGFTGMAASLVVALLACRSVIAADLNTIREQDPPLGAAPAPSHVARFHPRLKALWLEALARPEADLKRQAADAIARAHLLGMPGLDDTVPLLTAELDVQGAHPVVRLALARALITLQAKCAAASLMKHARTDGPEAARLLEPVLAQWDYAPMRQVWLDRLADAKSPRSALVLAVRAASVAKLDSALPHLRRLALDRRGAIDVRLEAARSLGALQPTGLEEDAQALIADSTSGQSVDRLLAAAMLRHHRGAIAEAILLKLAGDPSAAVAGIAAGRLIELGPTRLEPVLDQLVDNADAELRLFGVRALSAQSTPAAMGRLGALLDDPHQGVRVSARDSLIRLASAATLKEPICRAGLTVLSREGPRGLEQAAVLLGTIGHEAAADLLVRRLDHGAVEVRVASAWALRRLAVPGTAGPILKRVQRLTDANPPGPAVLDGSIPPYRDLEHLIEALGVMRYRPAEAVLRSYLPPPPVPFPRGTPRPTWLADLRSAAIWSLGKIHDSDAPADLAGSLRERLAADSQSVRVTAAISLGRMKVKTAIPDLRRFFDSEQEELVVRRACGWALGQASGESLELPPLIAAGKERWYTGWFLEPIYSNSKP